MAQANTGIEVVNIAITDAAWTAVTFTKAIGNVLMKTRTAADLLFSHEASGAAYFTTPFGVSLDLEFERARTDVGYVKASAGNDTLEAIGLTPP